MNESHLEPKILHGGDGKVHITLKPVEADEFAEALVKAGCLETALRLHNAAKQARAIFRQSPSQGA